MNWTELPTVKLGDIGEAIVADLLRARGYTLYRPDPGTGHLVDFICITAGGLIFAAEVKCYPRLYTRPETGIDRRDFDKYVTTAARGVDVLLFFVDEFERMIYFASIGALTHTARHRDGKTYFPLEAMTPVRRLTGSELWEIRRQSTVDRSLYRHVSRHWSAGNPDHRPHGGPGPGET